MSVRLFVLGRVYRRETHGYEIKEVAVMWGLERWANIGFGSPGRMKRIARLMWPLRWRTTRATSPADWSLAKR